MSNTQQEEVLEMVTKKEMMQSGGKVGCVYTLRPGDDIARYGNSLSNSLCICDLQ